MKTDGLSKGEATGVDNLRLHRQMYERRLRLLREYHEPTESDLTNDASESPLPKREDRETD